MAKKKTTNKKTTPKEYIPSQKEIINGQKVLSILQEIDEISYHIDREDLFTVEEQEMGLEITIDAEEDIICLIAEICEQTHLDAHVENWQEKLV